MAVAAIFLGFRLDVAGYDSYLPDADKVAYAGIYCDALDNLSLIHIYLTENKLLTLEDLQDRLSSVSEEFEALSGSMKKKSARIKELQELIRCV